MALKQKKLIGLEITSKSIKAVLVDTAGKIRRQAKVMLPETENLSGSGHIDADILVHYLKSIKKMLRSSYRHTALCLNSSDVIVRVINLPVMDVKNLRENIKFEFSGFLPEDPENYYIDYITLDNTKTENREQAQLLVFAAPKRLVKHFMACAKAAGFKIKYVDVLENAYEKFFGRLREKNLIKSIDFVVAYVDRSRLSLSIYDNGRFFINKSLNSALDSVYDDLANQTDQVAEAVRSVFLDKNILDINEGKILEREVLLRFLNELSHEISKVLDYFKIRKEQTDIDTIYFTGEISGLAGAIDYLGQALDMKVATTEEISRSLFQFEANTDKQPDYTNVVAVTLREV